MAKDTANSRIPRFEAVGRIPVQSSIRIQSKSHIATGTLRPTSFVSLRPSVLAGSIKNLPSGDKIIEAQSLICKKNATTVKRFHTKPEICSNIDYPVKRIKEELSTAALLDRGLRGCADEKDVSNEDGLNPSQILSRSQTFIREKNEDDENDCLRNSPGNVIPTNECKLNETHTLDKREAFQEMFDVCSRENNIFEDNISCERLSDISIPSYDVDATIKPESSDEIDFGKPYSSLSCDQNTTISTHREIDMKFILSSSMNSNDRIVDGSTVKSPFVVTSNEMESPEYQATSANHFFMPRADPCSAVVLQKQQSPADLSEDSDEPPKSDGTFEIPSNISHSLNSAFQEMRQVKPRSSFGCDLSECTLDCSIELCDVSLSTSVSVQAMSPLLKKQNSFEMDESLGILTPDQMKEFLDSATTTTNLDLPINLYSAGAKLILHEMRIDQTPSPEDLPLDPVGVKTDVADVITVPQSTLVQQITVPYAELSQTDSDSKMDQMTKSSVSKVSTSFITSVTSITSLDTGYQGDGEMSRPASRGAVDHSPSNLPRKFQRQPSLNQNNQNIPVRRQDPMTDSDFFTESDADDIFHKGDRRAQVIDGQLYGPSLQPANVFITEQPHMEDSCMDSSGIFTDVENRCEDDIARSRREMDADMSPDGSTDTVKSNNKDGELSQGHSPNILTDSLTSANSSLSYDRTSVGSFAADHPPPTKRGMCDIELCARKSSTTDKVGAFSAKEAGTSSQIEVKRLASVISQKPLLVKKPSATRKQNVGETAKSSASAEKSVKTGNCVGKSLVLNSIPKKKSSSPSLAVVSETCNGDMFAAKSASKCAGNNEENRRPPSVVVSAAAMRKLPSNKWDAVMSKIAESRVHKKNYSDVKSKVSTGVLRRDKTIGATKSSPSPHDSNCPSVNSASSGFNSPQTKRILQGAATKRARSYDSQQSSQSDLSLSGGSPGVQSKPPTSARSAKKRDVRTISISPTDLKKPPNLQPNLTSRSKAQPVVSQKRTSQINHPKQSSPLLILKGSPAKKTLQRRVPTQPSATKAPLKDHNRVANQAHQQQSQHGSPKPELSGVKSATQSSTTTTGNNPFFGARKPTKSSIENSSSSSLNTNNGSKSPPNGISNMHLGQHQQFALDQKSSQEVLIFQLAHANKGVQALGVLLQYLVNDLEAFSCPLIREECSQVQKKLEETQRTLEQTKVKFHDLQDELQDKESYYAARESELQTLHCCEIQKLQSSLNEIESNAKERISALEAELASKDATSKKELEDYIVNAEAKFVEQQNELQVQKEKEQELLERLNVLVATENDLRQKIMEVEANFIERIEIASQRERDLTDKINLLNSQLDCLRCKTEGRERELEEKLNLSHDEISVLRSSRSSVDYQNVQPKNGSANKVQMLENEVESLRSVLELKQSEISDLRKHNLELQRTADEIPAAQMKISALESRLEDLNIQLKAKTKEEKELIQKNKQLQESYSHEIETRNRLCLRNEELQWRLKQNSEKFTLALTELSKSYQEQVGFLNNSKSSLFSQDNIDLSHNSSLGSLTSKANGADRMVGCFQMDDISPPTSPVIKGVIEKNDSVSWVLEMDDESPEALASRMVRRAGSFRSSLNEKSPACRRQFSLQASSSNNVNPLSQSASTTAVIRHSSEGGGDTANNTLNIPTSRTRSKSVTIKRSDNSQKKHTSSMTAGRAPSSWKDPVCTSSPYPKMPRDKLSSPKDPDTQSLPAVSFCSDNDSIIFRKSARNLITCDTSVLIAGDRIRQIPSSHPSVQDFKNLKKKCQEIQESAGEAMVSGTNSEDEGCSASSDETASSTSSGSTSSSVGKQHLSIEDALLMEKISTSLGGTPMEVSWSDDADQFPSESVV